MTRAETVAGLRCHIELNCGACPYTHTVTDIQGCFKRLADDSLALLDLPDVPAPAPDARGELMPWRLQIAADMMARAMASPGTPGLASVHAMVLTSIKIADDLIAAATGGSNG